MIANEVQRRVTRTAIREFEEALAHVDEQNAELDPRLRRAMREAIESQLFDLRQELAEYDAIRSGHLRVLELDSLEQLPEALIRARIAAGLSQKELAGRLGLKEQQIQRWEARRYAGASLERVQAVADALGVQIHERVLLPTAPTAAGLAPSAARVAEGIEAAETAETAPAGAPEVKA